MLDSGATRKTPYLVQLFLLAIMICMHASPLWSADSRRVATVPALGVLASAQYFCLNTYRCCYFAVKVYFLTELQTKNLVKNVLFEKNIQPMGTD